MRSIRPLLASGWLLLGNSALRVEISLAGDGPSSRWLGNRLAGTAVSIELKPFEVQV